MTYVIHKIKSSKQCNDYAFRWKSVHRDWQTQATELFLKLKFHNESEASPKRHLKNELSAIHWIAKMLNISNRLCDILKKSFSEPQDCMYKHWYSPIFIPLYIWLFNKNWCANFAVIWGILSQNSLWMKTLLSNLLLTRYYFIFTRGERIFSGPYPISVGERHLEKIRQDSVFADRPMIIYINCWLFSILFDCVFREIEYKFSE